MKKSLLVVAVLLFLGNFASAQVLEGFEKAGSLGIFKDAKWGTLSDSIYQTTFNGHGVMALAINNTSGLSAHNAIRPVNQNYLSASLLGNAQVITFWVFIPDTATPNINLQLWWQPSNGWAWTAVDNYVQSMPKNKWFPLSIFFKQISVADPTGHDLSKGIGDFGIQFDNSKDSLKSWKGVIYVDNVSLVGAQPKVLEDFSASNNNIGIGWTNGWTDSLYHVSSIGGAGALALTLKNGSAATGNALAGTSSQIATVAQYQYATQMVAWVWVDSTFADSAQVFPYAQDRSHWADPAPYYPAAYYGKNIPKRVWYPLYFDIGAADVVDITTFNTQSNGFGWAGLMVGGRKVDSNFTVYMSRMELLDSVVISKGIPSWNAASFTLNANAFYVPSNATGSVKRYLDVSTNNPGYVLQGTLAITGKSTIFEAVRDSVPMKDAADSVVISASLEVYVPLKMPKKGLVKFYLSAGKGDSVAVIDTIGSQLNPGFWTTMKIDSLDVLAAKGKFNPTKKHQVGLEIYYPFDTTVSQNIEIDNLVFTGDWFGQELGVTTGVTSDKNATVKKFQLYANYPNPFNPTTNIKYDVQNESQVQIKVYDILGKEVATLVNEKKQAGSYQVTFNAANYTSGVYFVKMNAGSYAKTQRIVLIK